MENAFYIILGSIITIFVTKLFEIFQSQKANKFELQKLYFERKISAAEEAIEFLQNEISVVEDFIRVYEKIPQSDITLLPRLTKELDRLTEDAQAKTKSSKELTNTMYMYFDFQDYSIKTDSNLRELLDLSLEVHKIDFGMEITGKILQESSDPKMKDIIYEDIKKRFPDYFPQLNGIVELGKKAIEDTKLQQKRIIMEMKKYDLNK